MQELQTLILNLVGPGPMFELHGQYAQTNWRSGTLPHHLLHGRRHWRAVYRNVCRVLVRISHKALMESTKLGLRTGVDHALHDDCHSGLALIWRERGFKGARWPLMLFLTQLLLNVAWSGLFFGLQNPGLAFAEIVVLWLAILLTTISFFRIALLPGVLFLPYLLWVTFATVLNFEIWRLAVVAR